MNPIQNIATLTSQLSEIDKQIEELGQKRHELGNIIMEQYWHLTCLELEHNE